MTIYPAKKPRRRKASPPKTLKRASLRRRGKKWVAKWRRAYHSPERVNFVKSLPCCLSGLAGVENAHVEGDGAGRKGHYTAIVPMRRELHRRWHRYGLEGLAPYSATRDYLLYCASETERMWQEHARGRAVLEHLRDKSPVYPNPSIQ